LAGRDPCNAYVSVVEEYLVYLCGRADSITGRADPLMRLRFSLCLRRAGLEHAVRALDTCRGAAQQRAALLELLARLCLLLTVVC
jgi:hypothetical protein